MPKLWILSDLHLEAVPHPEAFRPVCPAFDVLVVAGDLWEGDSDAALRVVAELAGGKPAVFVLGNHEPWNGDLQRERDAARRGAERHGVLLLDDDDVVLANVSRDTGAPGDIGVRFVGGTLWADGRLGGQDARPGQPTGEPIQIAHEGGTRLMTFDDEAALHVKTRAVLEAAVARPETGQRLVVVTHHAPHLLCLPEAHRTEWVASNAASDLSHLTDNGGVALWVHGHVHDTVDLLRPGGTRIVCNPAGPRFTNPTFRDDWVVTV